MQFTRGLAVLCWSIALWLTACPAHADKPDRPRTDSRTGQNTQTFHDPTLTLSAGANYMAGAQDGSKIERKNAYIEVGYRPHYLLEAALSAHVGQTTFSYHVERENDKTAFNGQLRQEGEIWLNPELRLRLMQTDRLNMHLFGGMEIPMSQKRSLTILNVHITAPKLGNVDATNFFDRHVRTTYSWYAYSLGLNIHYRMAQDPFSLLGRLELRAKIGVNRFSGEIELTPDAKSQSILKLLGYQDVLKTTYPINYVSPVASLGADYRIGGHVGVTAAGMAFPTSDGWFYGANASLRFMW